MQPQNMAKLAFAFAFESSETFAFKCVDMHLLTSLDIAPKFPLIAIQISYLTTYVTEGMLSGQIMQYLVMVLQNTVSIR